MNKRDELELLFTDDDSLIFWDGLDDAIVGYSISGQNTVVVYDYDKCIQYYQLMGMSFIEALEFADFNLISAHVGDCTPQIIKII